MVLLFIHKFHILFDARILFERHNSVILLFLPDDLEREPLVRMHEGEQVLHHVLITGPNYLSELRCIEYDRQLDGVLCDSPNLVSLPRYRYEDAIIFDLVPSSGST